MKQVERRELSKGCCPWKIKRENSILAKNQALEACACRPWSGGQGHRLQRPAACLQVQVPQLIQWSAFNKSPNLLQPLFPHLSNWDNNMLHRKVIKIIPRITCNGSNFISPYSCLTCSSHTNLLVFPNICSEPFLTLKSLLLQSFLPQWPRPRRITAATTSWDPD